MFPWYTHFALFILGLFFVFFRINRDRRRFYVAAIYYTLVIICFLDLLAMYIDGSSYFGAYHWLLLSLSLPYYAALSVGLLLEAKSKSLIWATIFIKSPLVHALTIFAVLYVIMFYTPYGCTRLSVSIFIMFVLDLFVISSFTRMTLNIVPFIKEAPDFIQKPSTFYTFFLTLIEASFILVVYARIYSINIVGLSKSNGSVTYAVSDALYFSVVTWTTLGYGDLTPAQETGRFFAASEAITGYVVMTLIISSFLSMAQKYFKQNRSEYDRMIWQKLTARDNIDK